MRVAGGPPPFSADVLRDIQGFVLSGYAHLSQTAYLFLAFGAPAAARAALAQVAPQVTSAEPWERHPDGSARKPRTTLNLAFTYAGLQALGLPEEALNTFEPEFAAGAAARGPLLGDTAASAPGGWELGGPDGPELHALAVLNAGAEDALDAASADLRGLFGAAGGGITVIDEQRGFRPTTSSKEPFGFLDSISQPTIERSPRSPPAQAGTARTGEFVLGYLNGYDEYPLTPGVPAAYDPDDVLPGLPGDGVAGWKDLGRHGTFLVYRKLAQDVAGFWNVMAARARAAGGTGVQDTIGTAAKCVGRWPSGAPLTLSPDRDDPALGRDPRRNNAFLYQATDARGFGCPIGAHIRRANPRDSRLNEEPEESLTTSNRHRILRRGTYFGADLFPRGDVEEGRIPSDLRDDGAERGLHFVALNASIRRQFEFVQTTWLNQTSFNGLFDDKDPIAADNDGTGRMTIQAAPTRRQLRDLPRFVTVRGAGYFFMPSLTTVRFLAKLPDGRPS